MYNRENTKLIFFVNLGRKSFKIVFNRHTTQPMAWKTSINHAMPKNIVGGTHSTVACTDADVSNSSVDISKIPWQVNLLWYQLAIYNEEWWRSRRRDNQERGHMSRVSHTMGIYISNFFNIYYVWCINCIGILYLSPYDINVGVYVVCVCEGIMVFWILLYPTI